MLCHFTKCCYDVLFDSVIMMYVMSCCLDVYYTVLFDSVFTSLLSLLRVVLMCRLTTSLLRVVAMRRYYVSLLRVV